MKYTKNYHLNQWDAADRVLREDFNRDNQKIDTALEETAILARSCYTRLLDETLAAPCQHWDIDLSSIDITRYQKLLFYPHLQGDTNQWVYLHINGWTSGYTPSVGNNTSHCGNVPMMNDPNRQNFGVCEFVILPELPCVCFVQTGSTTNIANVAPGVSCYRCPSLGSASAIETLNLWFDSSSEHILAGSNIQLYGLKR